MITNTVKSFFRIAAAELIWLLEGFYLRRARPIPVGQSLTLIAGRTETPTNIFLVSKFRANAGGHLVILHLFEALVAQGGAYALAFDQVVSDAKDLKALSALAEKLGLKISIVSHQYLTSARSVIYTNWESYYRYRFLRSTDIPQYMLVLDCEFMFFPHGYIYALAFAPYLDKKVKKISLGSWPTAFLASRGIDSCPVPFPITGLEMLEYRKKQLGQSIDVCVYIKHSFRRAGGALIEQLKRIPPVLDGRSVSVHVFGYKPILMRGFPQHVRFLGFVSEAELCDLVERCHVGVTYSLTNISLLPFQMIWAGTPVIEAREGSASAYEICDACELCGMDAEDLLGAIRRILADYEGYCLRVQEVRGQLEGRGYGEIARQFHRICSNEN